MAGKGRFCPQGTKNAGLQRGHFSLCQTCNITRIIICFLRIIMCSLRIIMCFPEGTQDNPGDDMQAWHRLMWSFCQPVFFGPCGLHISQPAIRCVCCDLITGNVILNIHVANRCFWSPALLYALPPMERMLWNTLGHSHSRNKKNDGLSNQAKTTYGNMW